MKRKVGRPIADHRHPDSPSLTPQVGGTSFPVFCVEHIIYSVPIFHKEIVQQGVG